MERRPGGGDRARPGTRASPTTIEAHPATGAELQWLVRRAFYRELGEPHVDGLREPRVLVFERNGEAVLAPLEGDVLGCWGTLVAFCWFLSRPGFRLAR